MDFDDFDEDLIQLKKKNTRAKIAKGVSTLLLAGAVLGGSILYCGLVAEGRRVDTLINKYQSRFDKEVVHLPDEVLSTKTTDSKYCSGIKLVDGFRRSGIKYCSLLDEYYTETGEDVARVTYSLTIKQETPGERIPLDEGDVLLAPQGYVLENGKAVKYTKITVFRILPVLDNVDDYLSVKFGGIYDGEIVNTEIEFIDVVASKPFSEIIDSDLVVDVDENSLLTNDYNSATFRMVKR